MTEENKMADIAPVKKTKRVNGLFVLTTILAIVLTIGYSFTVDTIHCTKDTLATKPDVIMLGSPWCPYCSQARRYFTHNKINYCEYDVGDSGEGEKLYSQSIDQGMPQVIPLLFIGDYQITGFNKARVEQLLTEQKSL